MAFTLNARNLILALTAICAFALGGATRAQDRGWATAIAWSPDGETIAVGSSTGVWLFDTEFNQIGHAATPELQGYPPTTMDWHANGDLIAVAISNYDPYYANSEASMSGKFPILVIDANRAEVISRLRAPRLSSTIRWHPEENTLLVGDYTGSARLIDAATGKVITGFRERYDKLGECCNSPRAVCWLSPEVIAVVTEHEIFVDNIVTRTRLHSFRKDFDRLTYRTADCVNDHAILTDNGRYIDIPAGTMSRVFSLDNTITFSDYWFHAHSLADIAYSPDGSKIVTSGKSSLCRVAVFDGQSHELLTEIQGSYAEAWGQNYTESIAWHPDGSRFAIVGQFDIRIWDAETYELLQRYDGFEAGYYRLFSSSDSLSEEERIAKMKARGIVCPDLPYSMLYRRP